MVDDARNSELSRLSGGRLQKLSDKEKAAVDYARTSCLELKPNQPDQSTADKLVDVSGNLPRLAHYARLYRLSVSVLDKLSLFIV
jgi:hypothetical protein